MSKHLLNKGERYLAAALFNFAHHKFKTDYSHEKIKGGAGDLFVLPASFKGLDMRFCLISQKGSMIINLFVEDQKTPIFALLSANISPEGKNGFVQNKVLSVVKNEALSDFFEEFCSHYEIPELFLEQGSVTDLKIDHLKIA